MEKLRSILESPGLWVSIAVIAAAFIITQALRKIEHRVFVQKNYTGKSATQLRLLCACVRYLLLAMAVLSVLQINGVNVTSIVTGLGIAGIVVGFALQDILKDVIMGLNIITRGFLKIGDVIRYEDEYWEVADISLRFLYLRNIDTNVRFTVSNRNITEFRIQPDYEDLTIPGDYHVPAVRMRGVCAAACREIAEIPKVNRCEFLGTDAFGESQIDYRIRIWCAPADRDPVRRAANGIIQDVLDRNDIQIPFNQLDVHMDQITENH